MNLQNKSVVLNVVLAIAVVVLGVRLVSGAEDAGESQTQEQAVLDNIATRTSIRDYEACTHHKRIGVRIPIFLLPPPYLKGNCQRWFLIHFHTCG